MAADDNLPICYACGKPLRTGDPRYRTAEGESHVLPLSPRFLVVDDYSPSGLIVDSCSGRYITTTPQRPGCPSPSTNAQLRPDSCTFGSDDGCPRSTSGTDRSLTPPQHVFMRRIIMCEFVPFLNESTRSSPEAVQRRRTEVYRSPDVGLQLAPEALPPTS